MMGHFVGFPFLLFILLSNCNLTKPFSYFFVLLVDPFFLLLVKISNQVLMHLFESLHRLVNKAMRTRLTDFIKCLPMPLVSLLDLKLVYRFYFSDSHNFLNK